MRFLCVDRHIVYRCHFCGVTLFSVASTKMIMSSKMRHVIGLVLHILACSVRAELKASSVGEQNLRGGHAARQLLEERGKFVQGLATKYVQATTYVVDAYDRVLRLDFEKYGSANATFAPSITESIWPSMSPTVKASAAPSVADSSAPSLVPTGSNNPSSQPSSAPTATVSLAPSIVDSTTPTLGSPGTSPSPSNIPATFEGSSAPSVGVSTWPSSGPTINPSVTPSLVPTEKFSFAPSIAESAYPTQSMSSAPTFVPEIPEPNSTPQTVSPTAKDSQAPSPAVSILPTVDSVSGAPSPAATTITTTTTTTTTTTEPSPPLVTLEPSSNPSSVMSSIPTGSPTDKNSFSPSAMTTGDPSPTTSSDPTQEPSPSLTGTSSASPTIATTTAPSPVPTFDPTTSPTSVPSAPPTGTRSSDPTAVATGVPSSGQTAGQTNSPTIETSLSPSTTVSGGPSFVPTVIPTGSPSSVPSTLPTAKISSTPSITASLTPSGADSSVPSVSASLAPSIAASFEPTSDPTTSPTSTPTTYPTISPTSVPTTSPTTTPTVSPSLSPTGVVMLPPDGSVCWNTTNAVTLNDVIIYLNEPVNFDPNVPRIYTFCPGSVVKIGYLGPGSGPLPFTLVGENLPLIPLNPNLHIRCGDSGLSLNNCTFVGGQEQVTTQADTVLISGLLPFLPFLIPGLPAIPVLPDDYTPDSSNFVIEGFTFEASAGYEQDTYDHAIVSLIGPGKDMVIKDCIFRNNVINGEATAVTHSAIYVTRAPAAHIGTGVYASLTILDTVFEDNDFEDGVVVTGYNGTATENSDPSLIELTVKDCTFSNNLVSGPDSTLAVIRADLHTTLSVEDSCFTSNTITGDGTLVDASIVSSNDGIASYKNLYGTSNTLPVGSTCPEIAQYTLNGALTSITSTSCSVFDAATCAA